MILEEAIRILREAAVLVMETERIPLAQASGRVLAKDLQAVYDQPPFPRSPLDGYAVRGEDTLCASGKEPVELRVLEKISHNPKISSKTRMGKLKNDSPKWGGVRRFMRGHYKEDGSEVSILAGSQASGTLSSMAVCNCLVEIPEKSRGKAGEDVKIYLL